MAFSWIRGLGTSRLSRAERRRAGRTGTRGEEDPQETSQGTSQKTSVEVKERVHKRWSWSIGIVLILVVVAVLAAGYYQEFYRPPRVWAGTVNDVRFNMSDLVQRLRIEQGLVGNVDLGRRPFQYFRELLKVELLRQTAPDLGISISDDLVEQALRAQFYPTAEAGQATEPGQLDQEYRNNLRIFLTRTGLSDGEFRGILKERLRFRALHDLLGRDIELNQEQVEVEWIRLDPRGQVNVQEVMERLQTEDFVSVALNVGDPRGFADASGYVGWLPRQAFPQIDPIVFGDPETDQAPLGVRGISPPIYTPDDVYIVRKVSEPELQPLSPTMGGKLNLQLVEEWQEEQLNRGLKEGWVKLQLNSKLYGWVTDQVLISAPRSQPDER